MIGLLRKPTIHRAPTTRQETIGAAAALLVVLLSGCGGGAAGPETASVTGNVTYKGEPIANATLTFLPTDGGANAQAVTDAQGDFEVHTYYNMGKSHKPGMLAGKYQVTAIKLDTEAIKSTLSPPKDLLPTKYGNPKTSELSATVLAGEENRFVFKLE